MAANIIINSSNITNDLNSKFEYDFPRDVKFGKDDKLAISHLNVYYSWFNISEEYNNNKFSYKWWDMAGDLVDIFDVDIPSGMYSVNSLYEYLQKIMVQNGHFLASTDGKSYYYFIELLTNSTYYSIEFRLSSVGQIMDFKNGNGSTNFQSANPAVVAAPTTWTVPANGYETPQIIIPSNSNFGKLIGFKPQTIQETSPDQTVNKQYSFLNDLVPNMNPSSSFIVTCNLIDNSDFSIPNDILYSFTIPNNVGFGDLITLNTDLVYSKIKQGSYKKIVLTIKDQDFNDMKIIDSNMLIVLSVLRETVEK
jgi:hypothetical protein